VYLSDDDDDLDALPASSRHRFDAVHHLAADLPPIADMAPRPASTAPFVTLLGALGDDARELLLTLMTFRSRRALAIACFDVRALHPLRNASDLAVEEADASWVTIAHVARLPQLSFLRVEGETYLPRLEVAKFRTLSRFKVGGLSLASALFLGAVIARVDLLSPEEVRLRLSDGETVRTLGPFREMPHVAAPCKATLVDFAALLGAITLNPHAPESIRGCFLYSDGAAPDDWAKDPVVRRVQSVLDTALAGRYRPTEQEVGLIADRARRRIVTGRGRGRGSRR